MQHWGLFALAEAAFNMVRMALAFRPCFPITFPRSSLATLTSNTVICLPSTSEIATGLISSVSSRNERAGALVFMNFQYGMEDRHSYMLIPG